MTHDELARSLAEHLSGPERMTWENVQLGPAGSPRPDVYVLQKSFAHPNPTAYECKVSRSDFLADATSGKWQAYLEYAGAVIFACEDGLIRRDEVPQHCGLTTLKDGRWRLRKRAIPRVVVVPQEALLKLLIDGVAREGLEVKRRFWVQWHAEQKIQDKFGEAVARVVRDVDGAQSQADRIIEAARQHAQMIVEETKKLNPLRNELCALLGLREGGSQFEIKMALEELSANRTEPAETRNYRILTSQLRSALERYGWQEKPVVPAEVG